MQDYKWTKKMNGSTMHCHALCQCSFFLHFYKITNMSYLPVLHNGFAQSRLNPPLLRSPVSVSGFYPLSSAPISNLPVTGALMHAHSQAGSVCLLTHRIGLAPPPLSPHWLWLTAVGAIASLSNEEGESQVSWMEIGLRWVVCKKKKPSALRTTKIYLQIRS